MKKTYAALALVVACVAATACTNPVQSSSSADSRDGRPAQHFGGLVLGSGSLVDPGEGVEPTGSLTSAGTDPGGQIIEEGRGGLVLGSGSFAATTGIE